MVLVVTVDKGVYFGRGKVLNEGSFGREKIVDGGKYWKGKRLDVMVPKTMRISLT